MLICCLPGASWPQRKWGYACGDCGLVFFTPPRLSYEATWMLREAVYHHVTCLLKDQLCPGFCQGFRVGWQGLACKP